MEPAGNKLRHLRAEAGPSLGSHALLQLNADNQIVAADLAMHHQRELILDNAFILKLRH